MTENIPEFSRSSDKNKLLIFKVVIRGIRSLCNFSDKAAIFHFNVIAHAYIEFCRQTSTRRGHGAMPQN